MSSKGAKKRMRSQFKTHTRYFEVDDKEQKTVYDIFYGNFETYTRYKAKIQEYRWPQGIKRGDIN